MLCANRVAVPVAVLTTEADRSDRPTRLRPAVSLSGRQDLNLRPLDPQPSAARSHTCAEVHMRRSTGIRNDGGRWRTSPNRVQWWSQRWSRIAVPTSADAPSPALQVLAERDGVSEGHRRAPMTARPSATRAALVGTLRRAGQAVTVRAVGGGRRSAGSARGSSPAAARSAAAAACRPGLLQPTASRAPPDRGDGCDLAGVDDVHRHRVATVLVLGCGHHAGVDLPGQHEHRLAILTAHVEPAVPAAWSGSLLLVGRVREYRAHEPSNDLRRRVPRRESPEARPAHCQGGRQASATVPQPHLSPTVNHSRS